MDKRSGARWLQLMRWLALLGAALLIVASLPNRAQAERVEDIASVAGVRSNQLVGYGLVVGLNGTGDQTTQAPFTVQSIQNMLAKFGVTIPANLVSQMQLKNVAAVSITADLPPFSKSGQTIDITVASIGNALSLRGGALLMTPLRGADGEVYAIAQGSVLVSGFGVEGKDGSRVILNVPSAGRIPNGATVERQVPNSFDSQPYVVLNLNTPDFTTAARLTTDLNNLLGPGSAQAIDAVSVKVQAPTDPTDRVAFIGTLQQMQVEPDQAPARVIINSRTGTIVISSQVRVMPAAVAHGSLSVTISERTDVSQPNARSNGTTVATPRSSIAVSSQPTDGHMFMFNAGVNLEEIVRAVNEVGAAPGDLVAILEALEQAGALHAQLIVI
ncbi:MAG TPA: flagellar basal body P-ring protein FlgI [Steroidobacteraceae bacterium]|nr:flagellar basal body P-ring protein FlgI [Steroidobacteraceae bacterium]